MINLRQPVDDYLTLRRALGFKLRHYDRMLFDFVDYVEQVGAPTVSPQVALAWATQPMHVQPVWWKMRLSVVRGFARYLQTLDPSVQVPPPDLLAYRKQRPIPYLYTEAEITNLLAAASVVTH